MGWERRKVTIQKGPDEPSLILWLIAGIVALVAGILLFMLHANQMLGSIQTCSVWLLSTGPLIIWITLVFLRGWLFNISFNRHKFESDEAIYAQQQWEKWASRYLAVLQSGIILPASVTPYLFLKSSSELIHHNQQACRIAEHNIQELLIMMEAPTAVLRQFPADLPLNVTLLTDALQDEPSLQVAFNAAWQKLMPENRPAPYLNVQHSHSFLVLDERLKSPEISVELILVQQLQGGDSYSDALAVLLLAPDDVVTKYQLKHDVRLLRPMGLDTSRLSEELALFFSTQTQANATQSIVGDHSRWAKDFFELLKASEATGGYWKTEQAHWLEQYAGISGPFSPWIMAAVTSDVVRLQQADCLLLATDNQQGFITTVTTGSQDEGNG